MKNRIRKMLLIACAAVSALLITACGGSGNDAAKTTPQTEDTSDDATAEDDAAEDTSDTDTTGKYATIQEFIDSDMMQQSLQQQMESLEGTGMSMTITGEENKLVYTFTIDDPDLSAAINPADLESSLDSQASTFESVAAILPAAIDVDNPVVVVRYIGSDGTELASREFVPTDDSTTDTATE